MTLPLETADLATAAPLPNRPSLAWACAFCRDRVRIYEGGRPGLFDHLDTCDRCGCRVSTEPKDKAALIAMVDLHLL